MPRLRALLLLLPLTACAVTGPSAPPYVPAAVVAASAWPAALGDAAHRSPTAAVGPRTGRVRWQRQLEGAVVPGPVLGVDGSVLAASNGGVLHALDPATGEDRWTFDGGSSYGSDLSTSPAVLADGTVLWPGPRQRLYALTRDGQLLWELPLEDFVLSPAVSGNRVYVADMSGTVLALDVGRGGQHREAWRVELGGPTWSSPAVGPGGRVYTTHDRTVVALTDLRDRAEVTWRYRTKDLIEVSPAVAPDGTVVVGTNDDDEIGLHPRGRVRWKVDKRDSSYSSAVVRDGLAYWGDNSGDLVVADATTGRVVRRVKGTDPSAGRTTGAGIWTAPLVDAAGSTYFGDSDGRFYGYDADGRQLFALDWGGIVASYPALTADGTLLAGSSRGVLYALR